LNAVGDVLGFKVSGLFAWLMWRANYLSKLPGLQRKLQVFLEWTLELVFPRDISLRWSAASTWRWAYLLSRSAVEYLTLAKRKATVDQGPSAFRDQRVADFMRADPVVVRETDSVGSALKNV
jgi:hypothetical protein